MTVAERVLRDGYEDGGDITLSETSRVAVSNPSGRTTREQKEGNLRYRPVAGDQPAAQAEMIHYSRVMLWFTVCTTENVTPTGVRNFRLRRR